MENATQRQFYICAQYIIWWVFMFIFLLCAVFFFSYLLLTHSVSSLYTIYLFELLFVFAFRFRFLGAVQCLYCFIRAFKYENPIKWFQFYFLFNLSELNVVFSSSSFVFQFMLVEYMIKNKKNQNQFLFKHFRFSTYILWANETLFI